MEMQAVFFIKSPEPGRICLKTFDTVWLAKSVFTYNLLWTCRCKICLLTVSVFLSAKCDFALHFIPKQKRKTFTLSFSKNCWLSACIHFSVCGKQSYLHGRHGVKYPYWRAKFSLLFPLQPRSYFFQQPWRCQLIPGPFGYYKIINIEQQLQKAVCNMKIFYLFLF